MSNMFKTLFILLFQLFTQLSTPVPNCCLCLRLQRKNRIRSDESLGMSIGPNCDDKINSSTSRSSIMFHPTMMDQKKSGNQSNPVIDSYRMQNDECNGPQQLNPLRSCLKLQNNPNSKKAQRVRIDSAWYSSKQHEQTMERMQKYNYTVYHFDALTLTQSAETRCKMIIDLLHVDGLHLLDMIKHAFSDLSPFIKKMNSTLNFTDHIQSQCTDIFFELPEVISFYKRIEEYIINFADYPKLFKQKIEMFLSSLISKMLAFCNEIDQISENTEIKQKETLYYKRVALWKEQDSEIQNQFANEQRRKYNKIVKKHAFDSDEFADDLYKQKHRKFTLHLKQLSIIKAMLFRGALILKNNLLSILETCSKNIPIVKQAPLRPIECKQIISSICPEMQNNTVVELFYYPQLTNDINTPLLLMHLVRRYIMKCIHEFVGDSRLFRMKFRHEQILKYIEDKNEWYLADRFSFYTNNPPKQFSKLVNINKKIKENYSNLISSISQEVDFNISINSNIEPHSIKWTEDLYLVTAVLMSEFNGLFGIENMYSGVGKINNITSFTTKIFIEIPQNHSFSNQQLALIYNTTRQYF